jgi:hypothetical protein
LPTQKEAIWAEAKPSRKICVRRTLKGHEQSEWYDAEPGISVNIGLRLRFIMAGGYFGGLGAGRGWHKFLFFIDGDELKSVFDNHNFSILANTRQSRDYRETPKQEYLPLYDKYIQYFQDSKSLENPYNLIVWLTNTKKIVQYVPISVSDGDFNRIDFSEPSVGVSPLFILYDERKKLLVDIFGSNNCHFGLELQFPKVVSYSDESHKLLHSTEGCSNFKLFGDLVNDIKSITKPCRIKDINMVRTTRIRISDTCKEMANNNDFFVKNNLTVL